MINTRARPGWSTSAVESAAGQTQGELAALATQLNSCNDSRGRLFRALSAVDATRWPTLPIARRWLLAFESTNIALTNPGLNIPWTSRSPELSSR